MSFTKEQLASMVKSVSLERANIEKNLLCEASYPPSENLVLEKKGDRLDKIIAFLAQEPKDQTWWVSEDVFAILLRQAHPFYEKLKKARERGLYSLTWNPKGYRGQIMRFIRLLAKDKFQKAGKKPSMRELRGVLRQLAQKYTPKRGRYITRLKDEKQEVWLKALSDKNPKTKKLLQKIEKRQAQPGGSKKRTAPKETRQQRRKNILKAKRFAWRVAALVAKAKRLQYVGGSKKEMERIRTRVGKFRKDFMGWFYDLRSRELQVRYVNVFKQVFMAVWKRKYASTDE
jgi:hypothetical protein